MIGVVGRRAIVLALAFGAGLVTGCADPELKAAGQPCVASSECEAGLVCDLGGSPPVCAGHITTDAAVIDAGPIDAFRPDAATDAAVAIDATTDAAVDAAAAQAPGI